ncbi:hypothetical protein FACS189483_10990 [Spirochaetia bacterium]|nr:hypothetical protein FACS189483_10990 [Spirochaetia bacterium]
MPWLCRDTSMEETLKDGYPVTMDEGTIRVYKLRAPAFTFHKMVK